MPIEIEDLEWESQKEFPGELNGSHQGLSVDVLVWSKPLDEHTIGWFDFNVNTWRFLVREPFVKFQWRYFHDEIDKPLKKKINLTTNKNGKNNKQ